MNQAKALETIQLILKDIFGRETNLSLDHIKERFCIDIPLPQKVQTPEGETWIYEKDPRQKVISQSALEKKSKDSDMMKPKKEIHSLEDLFSVWEEVNYMTGEKIINSKNVSHSDSISNSIEIYSSSLIINSKNILFSHNINNSNYLLASKGSNGCNLGLRLVDSIYCTSSYEVRWSSKISKSFFITDCFDLVECMFCFGIKSKKYCIANMQFEKEEYFKIKQMVIDWILKK